MKRFLTKTAPFVIAMVFATTSAAMAQTNTCLSDGDIQNAISNGQILSLDQIVLGGGLSKNDVVGRFKVCSREGTFYYELPVLIGGKAQTVVLNALTGRP